MKQRLTKALMLIIAALSFVILFYEAKLGLNLVVWELLITLMALLLYPYKFRWPKDFLFPSLWIFSMAAVLFSHTAFAITMNIIVFVICVSYLLWPAISFALGGVLAVSLNIVYGSTHAINAAFRFKKPKMFRKFPGLAWSILGIAIVLLFLLLYTSASKHFSDSVSGIFSTIDQLFGRLFNFVHIDIFKWFLLGILFSAALLMRTKAADNFGVAKAYDVKMKRLRYKSYKAHPFRAFFRLYGFASMLMIMLNILILYFNIIDVINVWFGFKWNGQLLREFVHEGTWLLVFCVSISVLLSLILYNSKFHFYSKNIWLKRLIILWLIQNGIMMVSVFIRNYIYVYYYNLAFLRIGVFIFLLCALIGMILLIVKIRKGMSLFWLIKRSFFVSLIVLSLSSLVNWNRIIASYNFAHYNEGFFHLDFMVVLPDNTLDILHENRNLLRQPIEKDIQHEYIFDRSWRINDDMNYEQLLDIRIADFEQSMQSRDWREWNYADMHTYLNLENTK